MKKLSLKIRLIISFCAAAILILGSVGLLSWAESREQSDEFFDTYQLLLAKQLATADWSNINTSTQQDVNRIVKGLQDDGEEEEEALGFAVFDRSGRMIFNDNENGRYFVYSPLASGFENQKIGSKKKKWRLCWIESADKDYKIAVGQEIEYREEFAFELIEEIFLPWGLGLGLLLLMIILLVHYELWPLRNIAKNLSERNPDDFSLIDENNVPQEIKPLVQSMNRLFGKIEQMLKHERSFISDSAHELRSPLTALKVQLEVAEMSGEDRPALQKALANLRTGIERSSRLVEQLLALSRLDSAAPNAHLEDVIDWNSLLANAIEEQKNAATEKNITITIKGKKKYFPKHGDNFLWSLLLRNVLDNAIRYSRNGSWIKIEFMEDKLQISNSGVSLEKKHLPHLGERFFRPAGQKVGGSGLGLSIVKRIVLQHGCHVSYNLQNDVFRIIIQKD